MGDYKDLKSGNIVSIENIKEFSFPSTGAKILLKCRPSIAKEISTD